MAVLPLVLWGFSIRSPIFQVRKARCRWQRHSPGDPTDSQGQLTALSASCLQSGPPSPPSHGHLPAAALGAILPDHPSLILILGGMSKPPLTGKEKCVYSGGGQKPPLPLSLPHKPLRVRAPGQLQLPSGSSAWRDPSHFSPPPCFHPQKPQRDRC